MLDKSKKYVVTGILIEQNYGVVEVWVDRIEFAKSENQKPKVDRVYRPIG